ncbi:hypothetical protein M0812_15653 [Anaeramoeba flamelloides]|uniref:Uncharacterized protein n=1 Tax=Anaeramoeba flamelloides TaxID=1746091 RepID=A0AAV7ZCI1_9EUKA|nr:hypothetical protein M0812_15653 [Anaeramoeba flamelloides]
MTTFHFQSNFKLTESGMNTTPANDHLFPKSFHSTTKIIPNIIIGDQKNDDNFVEPKLLPFIEQKIQPPLSLPIFCSKEESNRNRPIDQTTINIFPICIKAQEITIPNHLMEL